MSFILIKFTPEQLNMTRQLSTTEGFCQLFEQNLKTTKTLMRAYELTEEAHQDLFGRRRYSGYHSFYTTINRQKDT